MSATPCLICGSPADSNEHYIPQWLSKATGHSREVIIKGSAVNGVVQSAREHGTAIEAFERNLCRHCNNSLGSLLESPVSEILKPLMAGDFSAVPGMTDKRRGLIGWWGLLHTLEHDFLEKRLDEELKRQWLASFAEVVGGKNPALPSDLRVHVALAKYPEVAFFLSRQLIDRGRGSVQAYGSFCWGMQAGHLILTVARMPNGARPAEGWGFAVLPAAGASVPTYDDIRYYYAESKIETDLAAASRTSVEG